MGRLVAHLHAFKPIAVVTHDAVGQLTGHPDRVRTHQVTLLAVEAAGHACLYPKVGPPWRVSDLYAATHSRSGVGLLGPLMERVGKSVLAVEDAYVTVRVDVTPWAAAKRKAVSAHRGEVARERPLPGILARLPEADRHRTICFEQFTRIGFGAAPATMDRLTA
ncbi:hypothetical protein [Streptomyces nymphaeiformis]|uniref:LmbE family N-acetylglucosaminyl deacetylase n=1 Tax=Streptomyces nymphaeiformis TaxID=2663842 RepID=A0A7W7TXB6_9ACTN|nr:hypothetical protein [Streptomyces nymphaeiformis]MBB4981089.1 LmbE family N-acetylglucosaminyl deacetylase [Streptomyces nymphaeiformis]